MHNEAAFFTLKELETLGKSKGVIPQAVKEVVEALVADGSVQSDKVGSQALFWALPSQKVSALKNKRQRLVEDNERLQKELEQLKSELADLGSQAVPSEQEAAELRARVATERKRREDLKSKVEALERCGPGKISEMKRQIVVAKEAANRWADNIITLRSMFLREQRGDVSSGMFNKTFNLPEDFDYLE
mmetsp:Transcript_57473/g.125909  ORF Transcript_57473/g.125909 Transcript_57473/m.125909 type:complete len:189 (-) Transcript_57473:209-775(-)